jgi:fermentation-respiration switch protein FrsA (DUF1100 family)
VFLAVAPVIWLLVSSAVAYRLTHRRRPRFDEPAPKITWGQIETERLKTCDGEELGAWFGVNLALPPILSYAAYGGLRAVAPVFLPHLDRISPLDALRGIPGDVPVLIMAGEADRLARVDEARAIFRAVEEHGKLVCFPGAEHGNLFNSDRERYEKAVLEFLPLVEKE